MQYRAAGVEIGKESLMAESAMGKGSESCERCGAPMHVKRVRSSIQTIAGPTVYVTNRECTNPECSSNAPAGWRAITDV